MADAFHQAAIAEEHKGVVVNDIQTGLVKLRCQQRLGQRHADGIGDALTKRTRGGLDARRDIDFRMSRRF